MGQLSEILLKCFTKSKNASVYRPNLGETVQSVRQAPSAVQIKMPQSETV